MIRLQRVGRKNDPSFRVVVVDSHVAAKTGKVIEVVGNYDARHGEPSLKTERINDWMSKGAQVSDTAYNLLVKAGLVKSKKKNVASKKLGKKLKLIEGEKKAAEEAKKKEAERAAAEKAAAEKAAAEAAAAPATEEAVVETPAE